MPMCDSNMGNKVYVLLLVDFKPDIHTTKTQQRTMLRINAI